MFKEGGYNVGVVSPYQLPGKEFYNNTMAYPGFSLSKISNIFQLADHISYAVEEFKPDIIIAHNFEAGFLTGMLDCCKRIKKIYVPHGLLKNELPFYLDLPAYSGIFSKFGAAVDKYNASKADVIASLTESSLDYYSGFSTADKAILIPPPFKPADLSISTDENHYHNSIFYSGNLDKYQRLDLLVSALNIVDKKTNGIKLIIGSSIPKNRWQDFLSGQNARFSYEIYNPSKYDDICRLACRCQVAAISRTDPHGYPMKIHLYADCGMPLTAFDCKWEGILDRQTALLAEPGNVAVFAENVVKLMKDSGMRENLGNSIKTYFHEYLSFPVVLRRFEAIL